MRPLEQDLVDRLELEAAVREEADTSRNLLPPEPWLDAIRSTDASVAAWVRTRLLAGQPNSGSVVVNARKAGNGIRPVPIVGVAERIAYRALAKLILENLAIPERSPEEYREFVTGPIFYAYEPTNGVVRVGSAKVKYVVETDITAFYQYVDHEVLRQELQMQTGHVVPVDGLIELLGEMSGRTFGLPQLLDPSDWLSDIYIQIVERDLLRRGFEVWRFNDDFRIGCKDYEEALLSLESIATAARNVGLVVGDHKTFTTTFVNYLLKYTNVDVDRAAAEFDPQDVEVAVTDYTEADEEQSVAAAAQTLTRIDAPPADNLRIDLKAVKTDEFRELRRAINALTRNESPDGLKWVVRLFQFAPALTPQLVGYLVRVNPTLPDETGAIWDSLSKAFMSDWQAIWLTYASRQMNLLTNGDRLEWVNAQARRHDQPVLRAEAMLALASANRTTFEELDLGLRTAPDALGPWYVVAIKSLTNGPSAPSVRQLESVRNMSPLNKCLLKD